jgi:hypothetical protein
MNAPVEKKRGRKKAAQAAWDKGVAAALPGNKLLAAVTVVGPDGAATEQLQLFGIVMRAHPQTGILLELSGRRAGEECLLPADTGSIEEGVPGVYTLRSGEEVSDPDFIGSFTVPAGWKDFR